MRMIPWCLAVVTIGLAAHASARANDACAACGCAGHLIRVCRPVHTVRRVERDVWDVVHEEYCLPRRLFPFRPCDGCCEEGGPCSDCQGSHAASRVRKRLIRKTQIEEVPITLWVVEYRCHDCTGGLPELPPPEVIGPHGEVAPWERAAPNEVIGPPETIAPPEINAPRQAGSPPRPSTKSAAAWQWLSLFKLGSKSPSVEDPTNEQTIR